MQTVLSKEIVGYGSYNSYVNKKSHPTNIQYSFERITTNNPSLHIYGWDTDTPIWNINYTEDGYNYKTVGCVTAFPMDEVQASIKTSNGVDFTVARNDPYEAFVAIVDAVTVKTTEEENQAFYQQYGY